MKRCIFSDAWIEDFRWKQAGDYVCYPCQNRLAEQSLASHACEHAVKTETNFKIINPKKAEGDERYPNVKVDWRRIEKEVPPPKSDRPEEARFFNLLKLEDIIWPRIKTHFKVTMIKYPYITSVLSR